MKTGKSITELAQEIERQQKAKTDFVTPTDRLEMVVEGDTDVELHSPVGNFSVNSIAHQQLAANLEIPKPYYDRMLAEQPQLLAKNVNTWFKANPKPRMVRTMDGTARAFLSDRYRPLENSDLAEAILPVLAQLGVVIVSAEITERRFYLKFVDEKISKDIPTGRKLGDGSHVFFDTLVPAGQISNSEVGFGALSIETGTLTKMCTNLAWSTSRSMKKYHVGSKHDIGEEMYAMLSDQTRQLTDAALWAQARDVVKVAFDPERFNAFTDDMGKLVQIQLDSDPVKVVSLASKKLGITEGEQGGILKHLIQGGDLTAYGLMNAVTRTAEDLKDYDRATEFERMGGKLIDLTANDWNEIKQAA